MYPVWTGCLATYSGGELASDAALERKREKGCASKVRQRAKGGPNRLATQSRASSVRVIGPRGALQETVQDCRGPELTQQNSTPTRRLEAPQHPGGSLRNQCPPALSSRSLDIGACPEPECRGNPPPTWVGAGLQNGGVRGDAPSPMVTRVPRWPGIAAAREVLR